MNGQCGIFLIKKKLFKIDMKPCSQLSVKKDPVSTDCVIQLVRWVFYCFFMPYVFNLRFEFLTLLSHMTMYM